MNGKKRIALLFGGRSAEREISLRSAAAVYKNLDKKKYKIGSFYINSRGKWKPVESPLLPAAKLEEEPSFPFLPWGHSGISTAFAADIYFPVLHGPYGEDGTIQGLLEMADVPYVGAGVLASAVGMDKAAMKVFFKQKELPIVRHLVFIETEWTKDRRSVLTRIQGEFPLPFFVKPANLGSSVGISRVKDLEELPAALKTAFSYDRKIIIEEGILGRELECSVLGNDDPDASLPGELIPFREFYDYRDKYINGKTAFKIPAELPSSLISQIQRLAVEAYKAIDCAGMARVDFFYDENNGRLYVNEVNTIPGFTEISMYPRLWEVSGLPFPRLLDRLIELGLERHRAKKRHDKNGRP